MSKFSAKVVAPPFSVSPNWGDHSVFTVAWGLAVNAEHFTAIPGTQRLRVRKTDHLSRNDVWIPPLKIWFTAVKATFY